MNDPLGASESLKSALLRRDTDAVWKAVHEQEGAAKSLQYVMNSYDSESVTEDDARNTANTLVRKIRRIQSTSRALARAFVGIMEHTIEDLSSQQRRRTSTYAASGGMFDARSPVLVQEEG